MEITIGSTNVEISEANFEAFRSGLLDAYMMTLREDGITTISDFLRKVSKVLDGDGLDEDVAVEIASQLEADKLGLHVFFRCLPFNDQPLMFLMNNPKLDSNPSDFQKQDVQIPDNVEVYDLDERYPDTSAMAAATANYLSTTLDGKWGDYSERVIRNICSATSGIDIWEIGLESYFQAGLARDYEKGEGNGVTPTKGFFKDFYYTNLYKIPTVDGREVFDSIESLAEETIHLEIELADPDVVFVAGVPAWEFVYNDETLDVSPHESTSADLEEMENAHGRLFKSTERYFVPLYHPASHRNFRQAEQVRNLNSTLEKLVDDGVL
ncbi:hypothetical protein EFA46_014535 (plasmid) [Halarchaeum sp. CBA1220]|uniref:uracil-DNA glycosylase family protein n=1 Tax=Halarchaeum sp. CBA1220 TaxID=1853682 RepID=UPI0011CDE985|nr:uracil-DNA glycosylase family protein [Halarchaeum sp. CBA1220]QLC35462.1 hypothetical protein EFA46_014535 [Halarchaeum sp. CBA1220]